MKLSGCTNAGHNLKLFPVTLVLFALFFGSVQREMRFSAKNKAAGLVPRVLIWLKNGRSGSYMRKICVAHVIPNQQLESQ